ncbi:leucine--tRNA ligase [Candidatus Saccharibacteria bacterium]|nr:leucine--tRNA ligase [Candidatus Saccharibacteria bacterium]
MDRYNPAEIEKKWQKIWEETEAFKAPSLDEIDKKQAKMYLAEMFPYPSGAGLHVGHVRNFTIVDVLTRFYTQQEMNVLRPFGYDTFGLPAENYAIKTGTAPQEVTKENIANFRRQAKKLGFAIDWLREINTSNPEYYKWTQWCFLQLYKKGLAYRKESYQWWCPVDQTVLANEQVENGRCWRCGAEVEKKKMKQWFFKITAYADELLDEIDALDWPDKIKTMQKNWIGRSEGAEIDFTLADAAELSAQARCETEAPRAVGVGSPHPSEPRLEREAASASAKSIRVFTTRPDTIFGATFLVLAPEHPLVDKLVTDKTREKVNQYQTETLKKSEIERQENKEKTGVFTGSYAINPATGEKIPIWLSDYVLMGYGEGAIMAVPAHDERDFDFAEKFDLPIVTVIDKPENSEDDGRCYHGEGELVNSGQFNGVRTEDAREQIVTWLEQQGVGKSKVTYRMRDWLISRQRYWGCPIPIAYDKNGEPHAIPEDKLPVILPEVTDYQPDKSGRSALAKAKDWLKVEIDGKEMTRETDTLDGYACSSWYLWRYVSPHDDKAAWDKDAIKYWAPTDVYVGADHAVAHLLYIRFWCKFFADEGLLPFREPVKKLLYNGYINAPDGKKMSKSKGNVIDPLDVIDSGYGADTLRTYEMFIGPYNEDASWDTKAIGGVYRFLNRCWNLAFSKEKRGADDNSESSAELSAKQRCETEAPRAVGVGSPHPSEPRLEREAEDSKLSDANIVIRNKTIKKVTEDLHRVSFNTAVAALMEYVNELYKNGTTAEDNIVLAKLLKPFAPHLACEILEKYGVGDIWPVWDESALVEDTVEVVVQVNGKLRAKIQVSTEDLANEEKLTELALKEENVARRISGAPKKVIIPKNAKLINIVA